MGSRHAKTTKWQQQAQQESVIASAVRASSSQPRINVERCRLRTSKVSAASRAPGPIIGFDERHSKRWDCTKFQHYSSKFMTNFRQLYPDLAFNGTRHSSYARSSWASQLKAAENYRMAKLLTCSFLVSLACVDTRELYVRRAGTTTAKPGSGWSLTRPKSMRNGSFMTRSSLLTG